ncbi:hypothetical protein Daqu01_03434 [Deinococcus aquaticus]
MPVVEPSGSHGAGHAVMLPDRAALDAPDWSCVLKIKNMMIIIRTARRPRSGRGFSVFHPKGRAESSKRSCSEGPLHPKGRAGRPGTAKGSCRAGKATLQRVVLKAPKSRARRGGGAPKSRATRLLSGSRRGQIIQRVVCSRVTFLQRVALPDTTLEMKRRPGTTLWMVWGRARCSQQAPDQQQVQEGLGSQRLLVRPTAATARGPRSCAACTCASAQVNCGWFPTSAATRALVSNRVTTNRGPRSAARPADPARDRQ